ncbi:hypothetical protein GTY20_39490 [Streptomyces sp. SID4946]|uniref:hypothetical protein n=1 Tax=Streptomyces sp. LamerLS-31b TaxID=1839765 RepID=UPI00081F3ED8|nr:MULTISPECIES: hypothetical protein [unclassified Streptomyces]MYQ96870.1 hypothetical protein [Streptomyces sp. SID4946]SCF90802.1 hypothetical protein GA0115258_11682 [Streptomyces sp. LamerLS-31b]SCG02485.1 hypothetical protein GA0115256_14562 [Streptomyces sp. DconLS]
MSSRSRGVRAARVAVAAVLPGELALAACLAAGVRPPGWALVGAEALVLTVLLLEAWVLRSLYVAARAHGADRRAARQAAVQEAVPVTVRRLVLHELRALTSLGRWVRRRTHGVRPGDLAAAYTGPQTAMMYGLLFVMVIETVGLAFLIPWPAVHRVILVLDLYGVVLVLALHAACVTRPHVVHSDGSLRIRYGALFDLAIPQDAVASVRVDRRYPEGRLITLSEDGVLDLIVGSQTSVTLKLNRPLPFTRPLGATEKAHTIRFHADDPRALVSALRQPA